MLKLDSSRRSGIASVIGTMLFVVVSMVAIGALAYTSSLQAQSSQAAQQTQQLLNQRGKESLSFLVLSGGTLAVENGGSTTSGIVAAVLKFANGSAYTITSGQTLAGGGALSVPELIQAVQTCGRSTCLSKYNTLLSSTNIGDSIGLVTSLGNTFWLKPAQAVQTNNPQLTNQITFDASGADAFGSNPVLVVDGITYALTQLPVTFSWFSGTQHSYAYLTLSSGLGTRVGISMVRGLVSTPSGKVTATSTGSVVTSYATQYLLSVSGGSGILFSPPSPTNDGWFNPGTTVYVTTNNAWNLVSSQSRADLSSWSVDAATPTSVVRSGSGTFTTGGIVMNAPHTLNFNGVTQYYLSVQSSVPTSGTVPSLSFGYSYITQYTAPQILSNPGFESGSPTPWGSATNCFYPGRIATSPVHSGSYSYQIEGAGQVYCWGLSQSVLLSIPTGAVVTSISASIWLYDDANGDSGYLTVTPSTGTCQSRTQSTLSAGVWTLLTTSSSGCSIQLSSIQLQSDVISGCYSLKGVPIYCGNGYADDAVLSIAYYVPSSGPISSAINSYSVSGSTITYTYSVSFTFPGGVTSKQLQTTLPTPETVSQVLIGSGPLALQTSQFSFSGNTLAIPDSTIAAYGGSFTIITTASASSVSQTGSVPALTVNYQYTAQTTVSQALSNPGFETGTLSPWSAGCGYGSAVVSSTVVHSGSYSAYSSYPNDAGSCQISQAFSAPAGGIIVSASGSVFVYPGGSGSAWMSDTCGSYWGVMASVQNSWQQLSKSDTCSSGTTYVTFFLGVQGNCVIKCYTGNAYWDDASFSYTYSMQYTGATATNVNSFQLNGATVTYQYLASYSFPGGSTGKQIQVTLPSSETLSQILVGSGPSTLSSSQYTVSGSTIYFPDSTIGTYGSIYTIVATSTGSYAFASSGSQTGDNWYDAGSSASISAAATGAISFSSWSGSPTIASPTSVQTTVVMSSYYAIIANFNIGP